MKKSIIGVLVLVLLFSLIGCTNTRVINEKQMVTAQINFSKEIFSLLNDMADSYSNYLSYNKSEKQFKEDITSFKERYNHIEKSYSSFKKEFVLDKEKANKKMVVAIENIEKARNSIGIILNKTIEKDSVIKREDLLKLYLSQMDSMQQNMKIFKEIISNEYYNTQNK